MHSRGTREKPRLGRPVYRRIGRRSSRDPACRPPGRFGGVRSCVPPVCTPASVAALAAYRLRSASPARQSHGAIGAGSAHKPFGQRYAWSQDSRDSGNDTAPAGQPRRGCRRVDSGQYLPRLALGRHASIRRGAASGLVVVRLPARGLLARMDLPVIAAARPAHHRAQAGIVRGLGPWSLCVARAGQAQKRKRFGRQGFRFQRISYVDLNERTGRRLMRLCRLLAGQQRVHPEPGPRP